MTRALCSLLVLMLAIMALAKSVFQSDPSRSSSSFTSSVPQSTTAAAEAAPSSGPFSLPRRQVSADWHRRINARGVSDRISLIDPADDDSIREFRDDNVVRRRRIRPETEGGRAEPSIDFGPEEDVEDPIYRMSRNARVKKRPIEGRPSEVDLDKMRSRKKRESVRDTFDRLAPDELRSPPEAAEDGTVVPITETADWYVPISKMSRAMEARRQRIRQCLDFYYDRPLTTAEDSSWSMMHHMIAWGKDSRIYVGPPGGRLVSTIGWMCANGVCDHNRLLYVKDGSIKAKIGPGLQGHRAQFLAMLAQSRVHIDQPIRVGSHDFKVRDLLYQEQMACVPRSELTFMLIGGAHYLHTETKWTTPRGQEWSIPRLIYEEMRQPINGVTCGGTHRLMGVSYAIRRREADGFPITGNWEKARRYTRSYQNKAFAMQNPDGSFSSDFWRSRGNWGDVNRKLKTTGHTLEWLIFSLPHDELQKPQVLAALDYLTNLLIRNRFYDWENGPLGHGIRALNLYDERVYGGRPGTRNLQMVKNPTRSRSQTAQRSTTQPPHDTRPTFIRGLRPRTGSR